MPSKKDGAAGTKVGGKSRRKEPRDHQQEIQHRNGRNRVGKKALGQIMDRSWETHLRTTMQMARPSCKDRRERSKEGCTGQQAEQRGTSTPDEENKS
eukprot:7180997-Heterocapsa_arctica.AAC.1